MESDRAIARWSTTLQRAVALSILGAGLLLSGCRGTENPDEQPPHTPFAPAVGDQMVFDGWNLDVLGFTVDSTKTRTTWDVLSTTATGGGSSSVILIRESKLRLSTNVTTRDTILLRVTPDGTLLRYGFLADLVLRREGRVIPRLWDTLSIPFAQAWTVGILDSAGQTTETATVPGTEDYFSVQVDSLSVIFAARRVEMDSERILYALWISTAPSCFPRLEEDPDPFADTATGSLLLLRQVHLAPR